MIFGIDRKEEACEVLASTYAMLASKVGQNKTEAYNNYMKRCLGRDNELVFEQAMKESYQMIRKDSSISWVKAYEDEKSKREALEVEYKNLKELNFL